MGKRDNLTDVVSKAGTSTSGSSASSQGSGKVVTSNGTHVTLTSPKPITRSK